MNFNKKVFVITAIFCLLNVVGFSQSKSLVNGIVQDSITKKIIKNANIKVLGTLIDTTTDTEGKFNFLVAAGEYELIINVKNIEKYRSKITVKEGENLSLNKIVIQGNEVENIGTAKIKVVKKTNTAKAVIQEVKKAQEVVSAISEQEIKQTTATDAAKVAARVPGVTLMENRFIMLRGLSQRYNSVQINNINAPSTEVDKRAFSFDLVPSNMLDKVLIYKSGSAELAGDFAGGVIKLYTKSNVEKDFLTVNIGLGYRVGTTFKTRLNNNISSGSDLLGYDNGQRKLPIGLPESLAGVSQSTSILYGKQFENNYALNSTTAPLDFGFGIGFGKEIILNKLKKKKLFSINNIGYSTSYQAYNAKRYRYQFDQTDYVRQMFNYNDENYAVESKINVLSNWIYSPNKKSTYSFKNMFNQIGENETTIRTGVNPTERPNDEWKNYGFHYTSRSIYFGQLEGVNKLNKMNDKLSYTAGYSFIKRNEPDFRRFRTFKAIGSNDDYTLQIQGPASLFDAARFYSNLNENTKSGTVNYEKNFKNSFDTAKNIVLKIGAYAEDKQRDFSARWLSYSYTGNPNAALLKLPINEIFNSDNVSTNGFKIAEGTNPSDKYDANNTLAAAYSGLTMPLGRLNVVIGARVEHFSQTLKSATNNDKVDVNLTNTNLLPSLNTAYYINDKSLVRLTYCRTINRPEFRELAPFVYYDFMYDLNVVGNPNLKIATIDNVDARYEIYPTSSETISVGAFYKKFKNPIENYVQPVGLSPQFTLQNASSATNYGAEIEVRKSLDKISQNNLIKNLSLVLNASYIFSQVDLGKDSTLSQAQKRPLQGQSPYIVNFSVFYNNDKKGLNANISYNVFGKRIAFVGNTIFPTVYEMPRHAIDLTFSKNVGKKLSLKFSVSDVLNFQNRLWQDTNNDGKIDFKKGRTDHELLNFRRGQMVSFGVSYKIK